MTTPCQTPIPFEELIAYTMRDLAEDSAERIEEHYFSCAYCSDRLEAVSMLDRGVRDLVHGGGLMVCSTMEMVERARARGITVREYRTDPGELCPCTAGPMDALLVTRYGGLTGVASADVHFRGIIPGTDQVIAMEFRDSPVDQRSGDVVLIAPGAMNRSLPPLDIEIRITAHTASGSHEVGPYHYQHRPWDSLDGAERERRAGR